MTDNSTMTRRTLLKGGAMGVLLAAAGLPVLATSDFPARLKAPRGFIDASSALLGVDAQDLLPTVRPDNYSIADDYYSILHAGCKEALKAMMDEYRQHRRKPMQEIGNLLLRADGANSVGGIRADDVGTAARLTLQLWLFGIWYGGAEVNNNPASELAILAEYRNDFVLSSRAYKEGWIWRFAQSHPMGYSQLQFGHWAKQPPALQDYMPGTQLS